MSVSNKTYFENHKAGVEPLTNLIKFTKTAQIEFFDNGDSKFKGCKKPIFMTVDLGYTDSSAVMGVLVEGRWHWK
jgi:hypothetical protein